MADEHTKAPMQPRKTLFSIVPERCLLTNDIANSFSGQFWGQRLTTASVPDSWTTNAPGGPCPLPLCSPSGLSRPQLLVAAQALPGPIQIPGLVSYCTAQGGWVSGATKCPPLAGATPL